MNWNHFSHSCLALLLLFLGFLMFISSIDLKAEHFEKGFSVFIGMGRSCFLSNYLQLKRLPRIM